MTLLRNIPLASSVPAPPDDGKVHPFDCSIRFEAILERLWAEQGRPSGPKPIIKPVGPGMGKQYPVKLKPGHQTQTKEVRAFAYPPRNPK